MMTPYPLLSKSKTKKLRKERETKESFRRKGYKYLLAGLLVFLSVILLAAFWYTLYMYLMPFISSFFSGWMSPYIDMTENLLEELTVTIGYWLLPAALMCTTMNVVWWKVTKWFIKGVRKLYGTLMKKFDEQAANMAAGKDEQ